MNLKQALEAFPPRSPFRKVLSGLLDEDETTREQASDQLNDIDRTDADPMATTWRCSEPEALALLSAAVSLPFPPPRHDWRDAIHDLLFHLVRSPYPSLVTPARQAYPRLSSRARCAVLSLLGACGTRPAAEAFVACIREHGWPGGVYSRVFTELPKLLDHADVLFPALIGLAGPHIAGVTDVLMAGLSQKKIDLAGGTFDLETVGSLAVKQLRKVLKAASRYQHGGGLAWRFAEEYWYVRREAGCWLDIAGYLKSPALTPLLEEALQLPDPRLTAFAAGSVFRRGGRVPKAALNRAAGSHETRGLFFLILDGLGKIDLFPARWRTWDAFAAANMVDWLIYPTELGREPDQLQKMAVFTADGPDGELALYVWRFRAGAEPWRAGISGPHCRTGEPRPVHGHLTFSRFDDWESSTAEQHAEAALKTLGEWRRARD
jgi:hypothetical protein